MIKFPNLIKAVGIMIGMVWGLYGNNRIKNIQEKTFPEVGFVDPYEESEMAPVIKRLKVAPQPVKGILKYPTIDLTRGPSKSQTLSAPLKSDVDVDLP